MKIKNQWIVFNVNADQILVETEKEDYYLYTYSSGFLLISSEKAKELIINTR